MIRRVVLLAACLGLGCGPDSPPAGPKHVPTDSAEAKTACPEPRNQAQAARENLLGVELGGEQGSALNRAAAEAVLAHAECEAQALSALPPVSGTHDQILAGLRAMRQQMQDATNLFREVARYDPGAIAIRASLAEAKLQLDFAAQVAKVSAPADLDARGREAFESELAGATQVLRLEVSVLVESALESIGATPEASALKPQACQLYQAAMKRPAAGCP